MEAVMYTFGNRRGDILLSPKLQLEITINNLKHNSKIDLLRLRGKYVNRQPEFDIIQEELKRRQHLECSAYTLLILGAVILIILLV